MSKYIIFTFNTDLGKKVSVRVPNVRDGLNNNLVKSAANKILAADALHPKHGNLLSKDAAIEYETSVTEIALT